MTNRVLWLALLTASAGGAARGQAPPPVVLPPAAVLVAPPPGSPYAVMPPAGKPVPTLPLAAAPFPPPGYRPSAYQHWQNYGRTYNGWLRPRVVQVTDGGYFLGTGAPYPYVYVFPGHHFMPPTNVRASSPAP